MATELTIVAPETKRRLSTLEMLNGTYISPEAKVTIMSEDEYETFTLEWATGFLQSKYVKLRSFAGAGDKGRDVVGYYADGSIDIYQCKHYDDKIAPTTLWTELGKLCYYTFIGNYPIPKQYFIVAPKGCGPSVLDFIDNPKTINSELIANWEKYCQTKITRTANIQLEGKFLQHVKDFDFSLLADIAPHELISQHANTVYHVLRFGGGLKKFRDVIPEPDTSLQPREQKYTEKLFEVYAVEMRTSVASLADLVIGSKYEKHFLEQRKGFYSAESLEKFGRENFPDADPIPFEELKDDAEAVLNPTLALSEGETGYRRVLLACQEINRQAFESNPLSKELKPLDKTGICHHLINEDRIFWIEG